MRVCVRACVFVCCLFVILCSSADTANKRAHFVHLDEEAHLLVGLECVVELDETSMMQTTHHGHLALDVLAVLWSRRRDELGGKLAPARQLLAPLHLAELAPV